jgi:hypothetical protein
MLSVQNIKKKSVILYCSFECQNIRVDNFLHDRKPDTKLVSYIDQLNGYNPSCKELQIATLTKYAKHCWVLTAHGLLILLSFCLINFEALDLIIKRDCMHI